VDIWWAGHWERLDNDNGADCRNTAGTAICAVEQFTEIYTKGNGHPDLTGTSSNRVDWRESELRTDDASWIDWTRPSIKGGPFDVGYRTCGINDYYRFFIVKGSC
jgi:hypothetical protein